MHNQHERYYHDNMCQIGSLNPANFAVFVEFVDFTGLASILRPNCTSSACDPSGSGWPCTLSRIYCFVSFSRS